VNDTRLTIRVGHSPDPDDAFMFYALAKEKIPTGKYRFEHQLVDIETLNRRALAAELELTAVSVHAYAHLSRLYVLCSCGASIGDRYGPMVVARRPWTLEELAQKTIAVPGTLTTAFLTLGLCLGKPFSYIVVPFDEILDAVAAGQYGGDPVDAGLVIHEGQLTYAQQGLTMLVDLGQWWFDQTGLPLPLGANAIRRDLGPERIRDVHRLLLQSIVYGLEHREEALQHALGFGRGLDRQLADRFVGMYVNHWTLDFGPAGRQAVAELLSRGHAAGLVPSLVVPEFVET
jgi:1,4-dihydroxy-6-naphthoate synthase